jgi:hypothetical protein
MSLTSEKMAGGAYSFRFVDILYNRCLLQRCRASHIFFARVAGENLDICSSVSQGTIHLLHVLSRSLPGMPLLAEKQAGN